MRNIGLLFILFYFASIGAFGSQIQFGDLITENLIQQDELAMQVHKYAKVQVGIPKGANDYGTGSGIRKTDFTLVLKKKANTKAKIKNSINQRTIASDSKRILKKPKKKNVKKASSSSTN